jgi:hypothetical protein
MPPDLDQADNHVIDNTPRLTDLRPGSSTTGGLPGGWILRHRVRSNGRSEFEILDAHHDSMGHVDVDARPSVTSQVPAHGDRDHLRGIPWS